MTGRNGSRLAALADICLQVPATDAARNPGMPYSLRPHPVRVVELATCISARRRGAG